MEPYDVIVNQPVVIDNVSKSFYSIYSKKKDVEWSTSIWMTSPFDSVEPYSIPIMQI